MKKKVFILVAWVLLSLPGLGQEIIRLDTTSGRALRKAVFGYFPEWEYNKARESIQYDLLSHIALFSFELQDDGSMSLPEYWPWIDVINAAHEKGVRVIITIDNYDSEKFYQFLLDSYARKNFYNQLESMVTEYKLDGVNINFEHLPIPSRNTMLNDFLLEMHDLLNIITPGAEVSFTGPAINAGGWDFDGLAASCDYIFIMGYDFKGGWSDQSGPSAPLTGGYYNLTRTLEKEYASVVASHPEKLILGVPYYGNKWITESLEPYANVVDHVRTYRYRDLIDEGHAYGLIWDSLSQTPWYRYTEGGQHYQVWFENRESLSLKYDLADQHGIKGIGIWALGYDRDYFELWDEISDRYFDTSRKIDLPLIKSTPVCIYPNPARDQLNIQLIDDPAVSTHVLVLDGLGRCLVEKNIAVNSTAAHEIKLDIRQLPSGAYTLIVRTFLPTGPVHSIHKFFKIQP